MVSDIFRYLKFIMHTRNHKGHGVHSPFSFDFITNVMNETAPFYIFSKIEYQRNSLAQDTTEFFITDLGTGNDRTTSLKELIKREVKPRKYGQLLFRIVNHYQSKNILELGTSIGITTAYLASVDSRAKCSTIEGSKTKQQIAKSLHKDLKINNIKYICDNIDNCLEDIVKEYEYLDFVYFDANHTQEATKRYYDICVTKIHDKSVFVFDDIHWSNDMEIFWNELIKDERIKVSFELYGMGIVFFNSRIPKQQYKLYF